MAQTKKTTKTPTKSSAREKTVSTGPRLLEPPKKKFSFQWLSFLKREKPPRVERKPLPSSLKLFGKSLTVLRDHWELFLGIVVIYAILNIILVKGFSTSVDLGSVKADIHGFFGGNFKELGTSLALYAYLLGGSSGSSSATAGAYQSFLILITSLAIVWALREVYAGIEPKIRDGYYKGIYPLIPVSLIVLVVAIEVIPFALGTALFAAVVGGGIATTIPEKITTGILCLGLIVVTLRWLCGSIFALYIAALPDMTPMKALRSARDLVYYRRLEIFRKILFIPIAILVLAAIIMTPIILFVTPLASWAFFIFTMIGLVVVHSYMYTTYREML